MRRGERVRVKLLAKVDKWFQGRTGTVNVSRQQGVATKGAIMDGLNMEIIKSLRIPLPPLRLQQKFAALVEQVERLRAAQREALRQAEHLFQTLLHRAFSETDSPAAKTEAVL
jgi:hypothetical protein